MTESSTGVTPVNQDNCINLILIIIPVHLILFTTLALGLKVRNTRNGKKNSTYNKMLFSMGHTF